MEHRWSLRKPYRCSVTAYSPFRGTAIGRIRNVGMGGMFIETGVLIFSPYAPLYVKFSLDGDNEYSDEFHLESMVVRRTDSGLGVMFLEIEPDVLAALGRALYPELRTRIARVPAVVQPNMALLTHIDGTTRALGRRNALRPGI